MATLHNIGKPRALGLVFGQHGWRDKNPYRYATPEYEGYNRGYWDGYDQRLNPPPIIAPDVPENKFLDTP